jgi:hypothetical protein
MNLRFAWAASALLVWTACGGAFTTTIDPGADAGTGGGATTGGAGTTSTGAGGSTGVGGSSSGVGGSTTGVGGSSSGVGGSSSGAGGGSAGSGGSVGTGGSGGSRGPDWDVCDGPGQCMALEKSCCGSCGTAELSAYAGVNTKRVQDFHTQLCPLPVACPAIACPQAINQNIAARCVAGHCQAFDVRKVPEYSSCSGDTDCRLRAGLGCCTCGGGIAGWVAVSKSGEQGIAAAECAPNAACPDCAAIPPPMTIAACTNHVCQVLLTP